MPVADTILRMITYSVVSAAICCSLLLLYKVTHKRGHRVCGADIIIILFVVILSGYRYNVGSDYTRYLESAAFSVSRFSDLSVLFSKPVLEKYSYQIGFQLLSVLGGYISDSPYTVFWLISLIIYPAIIVFARKHTENSFYAVCIYLLFGFWGMSLNVLKQAMAMVFILYGYNSFEDKKYFRFSIYALLAVFLHTSSIIAIFGVMIANLRIVTPSKKIFWVFITVGICLRGIGAAFTRLFSHVPMFEKYLYYFSSENGDRISRSFIWIGALIETVFVCVIVYIALNHINKLQNKSKKIDAVITMIMIGIPLSIMGISQTMWIANRLAKDFFLFLIILWPIMLDRLPEYEAIHGCETFSLRSNSRQFLWIALLIWRFLYSILMVDNSGYMIQTYLFM